MAQVADEQSAKLLFDKGMLFAEQRRLDSAAHYLKQVIPFYKKKEQWLFYFEAQYYVCLSYTILERDPAKTNDSLMMLLSLSEKIGDKASDGAAEMYFALGWLHDNVLRDRTKAKEFYLKSLEIRKQLYGDYHIKTAKSYSNAAQVCLSTRDLAQAEKLLITALQVYPVVYGSNHPENFRIYGAAFNVYEALGQLDKSLRYAQALYKFIKEKQMPVAEQMVACRYLTQAYFNLARYENAMEYALEEKMLLEGAGNTNTIRMSEVLNNIGRIYEFTDPPKSPEYTLASLKQKEALLGFNDALTLSSYLNYGNLLSKSGDEQNAEFYLRKGLAGYQNLATPLTHEIIRAHGLLARHYYRFANAALVEEHFNRARFLYDNAGAEVSSNQVAFSYYCLAVAAYLANLKENPEKLLAELEDVKRVFQQQRNRVHLPADEQGWINTSTSFHAYAVDALYAALERGNNNSLTEKLFEAIEESKALVLLPMFRLAGAKDVLDVPGDLLKSLSSVKTQISEKELKQTDETQLITLNNRLDSLLIILKSNYPSYYAIRYGSKVVSISDVQAQLDPNHALVQYFKSQNNWYAWVIYKEDHRLHKLPVDFSLDSLAMDFRYAIINRDETKAELSAKLFKAIWKPLEIKQNVEVITVVPDGALHHISFASIHSEDGFYLAQQYAFSYEGSASLFVEKSKQEVRYANTNFVAFAPSFPENQFANMFAQAEITRAGLEPLKGAEYEVKRLTNLLGGKALTGNDATSKSFIDWVSKANVIHLATHAVVDDANPAGSRFVFAPKDTLDEGFLYAFELLNINIRAALVTLSACNTGFGAIQRGEGVMSLARAFEYAGCPNILMSLWPVSDQVTAEFMEVFYTFLKQGLTKDQALREAQLSFINAGGPKSDPYYWAGFVFSGNPDQIEFSNPYTALFYVIPIVLILIAGLYYYRKSRG